MRSVLEPACSLSRARELAATCNDGRERGARSRQRMLKMKYKLHSILYSCLHPAPEIDTKPLDENLGSFCYSMNLRGLRQTHFPLIGGKVSPFTGCMGARTTVFLYNIHVQLGWRKLFDLTISRRKSKHCSCFHNKKATQWFYKLSRMGQRTEVKWERGETS